MATLTPAQELQQLLQGPALAPPPGVIPSFDNPPNLNLPSYVMAGVSIALPTIVVILRLYTKIFIVRAVGWEDWVTLLACSLYVPYVAYSTVLVGHGAGRHQWDVQLKDLQPILFDINVLSIMYGIITFLVKFSILLQYLHIFSPRGNRNFMWWGCWGVSAILFLFYLTVTFIEIFLCNPREKFWTPWLTTGRCINANDLNISAGVINALADLIIIILPQGSIWRLNMSQEKKMKISFIFFIALFALAASIVRLYYAFQLANSGDVTYNVDLMGLWTYAEFTATFFCSCLPSLAGLVRHIWPSLVAFTHRFTGYSSSKEILVYTPPSNEDKSNEREDKIRGPGKVYATTRPTISEVELVRNQGYV